MTRRRMALFASMVMMLLASGCGENPVRPGGLASASPTSGPAPSAPPAPEATTAAPAGEVAANGTRKDSAASPSAGGPNSADPAETASPAALEVTVVPACVRPGSAFEVRMISPPRARLSMIIGYSDDQPHGAMGFGDADAQGLFVWSVVAPADVPPGQAKVLVGMQAEDGGDSGSAAVPFEVARSRGCG